MATIKSIRSIGEPESVGSYFEEMCWQTETGATEELRQIARQEVDRMVQANNDALEEDQRKKTEGLIEYIGEFVGELFEVIHFRPNDYSTRSYVLNETHQFLNDLRKERHIRAFKALCDDGNNPWSVLERNELGLDIFVMLPKETTSIHLPYIKSGMYSAMDPDAALPKSAGNSSAGGSPGSVSINPAHGGYPSTAPPPNLNTITISGTIGGGPFYSSNIGIVDTGISKQTSTSKLDSIVLTDADENGVQYRITFEPERSISAYEALLIYQMFEQIKTSHGSYRRLSPLAFIREQNLERHFKFTT